MMAAEQMQAVRGIVFDVQRMSMHDGPGMRTNVFLKGCPLRCGWCANPESQERQPQLTLHAANCIDCGLFAQPCSACWGGAVAEGDAPAPRDSARGRADWTGTAHDDSSSSAHPQVRSGLADRVDLCPTGALHWAGEWRTAGDIMAEVRRDRPFYGTQGGLTLTGGEPTMQPALCEALLWLAHHEGIATAIETCGHTQWEIFERLLPLLDVVLFDVKHTDPLIHAQHTGFDNRLILANLRGVAASGVPLHVRIPLIPGLNADPQAISAIGALVAELPGAVASVDLLPYHTLGKAKYAALGRPYPWEGHARLPDAEIAAYAKILRSFNLPVTIGG